MALQYKAKPWSELTTNEFYDIMQLRIQCFIVDLQTCYQDMEAYYDKCGWYMMYYKGNVMVGCNQLCTRKELNIPILLGEDKHGYQGIETLQ